MVGGRGKEEGGGGAAGGDTSGAQAAATTVACSGTTAARAHDTRSTTARSEEGVDMAPNEPAPASGPGPAVDPATGRVRELEAQVLAQAVQDPAFRARLLADPKAVFAERGLSIPPEVKIQALEETAQQYYLVLPAAAGLRAGAGLSDAELEHVAGGGTTGYTGWTGCGSGQEGCIVGTFAGTC
jgi:Nitrile hydratase, alpha chain